MHEMDCKWEVANVCLHTHACANTHIPAHTQTHIHTPSHITMHKCMNARAPFIAVP